jgi:hypothetical protein
MSQANLANKTFKEHKMSVLTLRKDGSIAVVKSITTAIADAFGDDLEKQVSDTEITSLSLAQRKKILEIRRRLALDTYDIDERLDAILESILMDIP